MRLEQETYLKTFGGMLINFLLISRRERNNAALGGDEERDSQNHFRQ